MHIAFLTPEYPHLKTGHSGGIGTSIKNLAQSLIELNQHVSVLVYGQKEDTVFIDNGIEIHQLKNVNFKGFSWYLTRKKIEKYINKLCIEQNVNIVEAPDWTGITSFIQPRCPIVIRLNGSDTYFCHLDKRRVKWQNKYHEKRALQNANGHIAVSKFTADVTNQLMQQHFQYTIIPNGIDANTFKQNNKQEIIPNTILYFGTLIRKKGVLDLPHIFNKIVEQKPEVQLILIGKDANDIISGEDSTWKIMQQLFSEAAHKKVSYLGSVSYEEIKTHIEKANVCIFPSYAEALPVSWLEAMAMQKAIVASNIGWANEMITDGEEGFLVHPTNHEQFANRILELLESSSLVSKLGMQARNKIMEKFDNKIVALQSLNFYKSILTNDSN